MKLTLPNYYVVQTMNKCKFGASLHELHLHMLWQGKVFWLQSDHLISNETGCRERFVFCVAAPKPCTR